ncbi:unnamed protein product [Peronospora effusa]|nr:unnamed protein product [Peronospora effusa]
MVHFTSLSSLRKRVNRVLVVGSLDTLQSQGIANSFLQQTLTTASSNTIQFSSRTNLLLLLLQHTLATLNPSTDHGSTSELLLIRDTTDALRVTLFALPTQSKTTMRWC